jgi:hypothetical protein
LYEHWNDSVTIRVTTWICEFFSKTRYMCQI